EATALLQQLRTRSSQARRAKGVSRAAAFKGGGWFAFSMHAALVSGLLAAFPGGAPGQLEELFREYGLLSSNSGGSWYAASLVYSEWFVELTGQLAAEPQEAEATFKDKWIAGLLQVTDLGNRTEDPSCDVEKVIQHYLNQNETRRRGLSDRQQQNLQALLPALWEGRLTWDIFVTTMSGAFRRGA
ncbi:unnamed protein product, partial [Prorocentrum cordatum]